MADIVNFNHYIYTPESKWCWHRSLCDHIITQSDNSGGCQLAGYVHALRPDGGADLDWVHGQKVVLLSNQAIGVCRLVGSPYIGWLDP